VNPYLEEAPGTIGGLEKSAGKPLPSRSSQKSSSDLRSLAYQFPVDQKARKTPGKFPAQILVRRVWDVEHPGQVARGDDAFLSPLDHHRRCAGGVRTIVFNVLQNYGSSWSPPPQPFHWAPNRTSRPKMWSRSRAGIVQSLKLRAFRSHRSWSPTSFREQRTHAPRHDVLNQKLGAACCTVLIVQGPGRQAMVDKGLVP
jgi:hypothetical protein